MTLHHLSSPVPKVAGSRDRRQLGTAVAMVGLLALAPLAQMLWVLLLMLAGAGATVLGAIWRRKGRVVID